MKLTKHFILVITLAGLVSPAFSQEGPVKDFAESSRDRKYCLYPSTLRMINIAQDPEYNQLVSGVEKLLIYQYNSNPTKNEGYSAMLNEYQSLKYEELITMYGGQQDLTIYGNDNAFVGIISLGDIHMVFYLKGVIAMHKIPNIIGSLKDNVLTDFITGSGKENYD